LVAYVVVAETTYEPGVISRLSAAIYEAGLNIEDLELLRGDDECTVRFRLVFENEDGVPAIFDGLGWRFAPEAA
jgi:acetolactate synthase small subunit